MHSTQLLNSACLSSHFSPVLSEASCNIILVVSKRQSGAEPDAHRCPHRQDTKCFYSACACHEMAFAACEAPLTQIRTQVLRYAACVCPCTQICELFIKLLRSAAVHLQLQPSPQPFRGLSHTSVVDTEGVFYFKCQCLNSFIVLIQYGERHASHGRFARRPAALSRGCDRADASPGQVRPLLLTRPVAAVGHLHLHVSIRQPCHVITCLP